MPAKTDGESAIDISKLQFSWNDGDDPILDIDHLGIRRGERVFIQGASGSGKSTLLNLVTGVVTPQRGTIRINGHVLNTLGGAARDRFRADNIGYIYQMFNLIPYLSVLENVLLACRFSTRRRDRAAACVAGLELEAKRLLTHLGMGEQTLLRKPVTELSVGQQQRVAAARALIGTPEIIIADEPTSSLDANHRKAFIQLLCNECRREKNTVVFVSHDAALETLFDRTVRLEALNAVKDGQHV